MTDSVKVSSIDVQRARLLVRLNEQLGESTPEYVVKIAEAKPPGTNGTSHHGVNGVQRRLPDSSD